MTAVEGRIAAKAETAPGLESPAATLGADACLPSSSFARGACPSLSTPMVTGDGLLVRLRPVSAGLTPDQVRALADAAERHGNGLLEITARGSLQLRGLAEDTIEGLTVDVAEAGIVPETGVTIETPPLSGLDPLEIADARAMAARLREAIALLSPQPVLAPKLTITVDGGSRIGLDGVTADIRLTAAGDADSSWLVAVGGTASTARVLASLPAPEAISRVVDLLLALGRIGPRARGRDLTIENSSSVSGEETMPLKGRADVPAIGIVPMDPDHHVLGLRLSGGQIRAADLIAFLDSAAGQGAREFRFAPDHVLLALGLEPEAAKDIKLAAANFGFITSSDEPANHIDSCAGKGACASAFYETKRTAADLIEHAAVLLDGSIKVHLSGCAKGCAHPAPAGIAIVGTPIGYGLVVNGPASAIPIAYIQERNFKSALRGLAGLVHDEKGAGESAGACLTRLDAGRIIAALGQE